jgi:hypothetical protein
MHGMDNMYKIGDTEVKKISVTEPQVNILLSYQVNCTSHILDTPCRVFLYIYIFTHTHTHIYIYTHTHIYIYVCVCVGGYEIDPHCSNGDALESDSVRSVDYGGGEDGTP